MPAVIVFGGCTQCNEEQQVSVARSHHGACVLVGLPVNLLVFIAEFLVPSDVWGHLSRVDDRQEVMLD